MIKTVTREDLFDMGIELDDEDWSGDFESEQIGVNQEECSMNGNDYCLIREKWNIEKKAWSRMDRCKEHLSLREPATMTTKETKAFYRDELGEDDD